MPRTKDLSRYPVERFSLITETAYNHHNIRNPLLWECENYAEAKTMAHLFYSWRLAMEHAIKNKNIEGLTDLYRMSQVISITVTDNIMAIYNRYNSQTFRNIDETLARSRQKPPEPFIDVDSVLPVDFDLLAANPKNVLKGLPITSNNEFSYSAALKQSLLNEPERGTSGHQSVSPILSEEPSAPSEPIRPVRVVKDIVEGADKPSNNGAQNTNPADLKETPTKE